jgi:ATP-dependent Clp protease ATP-binding subunit ClpA
MNLPGGLDEGLRKGIGFNNIPTRKDIRRDVTKEIKNMLSGAFLSRIGTPIVFEQLDGPSLGMILERSIRNAALTAAEHLNAKIAGVDMDEDLGTKLLSSMESSIFSYGARAILEHGRILVSGSIAELGNKSTSLEGKTLYIKAREGKLTIQTR